MDNYRGNKGTAGSRKDPLLILNVDLSEQRLFAYDDLIACGSHAAAKEKGLIRLEGKEYVVKDGDIMLFRFNV